MKRLACLLLCAPLLLLPACDDDPADPGDDFAVTLHVRDAAGDPVAGEGVALLNDGDYLQDARAKAHVAIPVTLPVASRVTITVEDIEGNHVRTLIDREEAAGVPQFVWTGDDDDQQDQPSGRYTVRMVARDPEDGTLVFEDTRDVLMISESHLCGVTGADGTLVLRDRRLFPQLYDRPPMLQVDSEGNEVGPLTPGSTMRFYFWDAALQDIRGRHDADVTGAGAVIDVVLPELPPLTAAAAPARRPAAPRRAATDPLPTGFELGQPYPNPFN